MQLTTGLKALALAVVLVTTSACRDDDNDSFSFGLDFRMPPEVAVKPLERVSVEVSWDGGTTWTALDARSCLTKKSCTVKLKNQSSGSASLRVSAAYTAGRAVTQTVIDAYAVG